MHRRIDAQTHCEFCSIVRRGTRHTNNWLTSAAQGTGGRKKERKRKETRNTIYWVEWKTFFNFIYCIWDIVVFRYARTHAHSAPFGMHTGSCRRWKNIINTLYSNEFERQRAIKSSLFDIVRWRRHQRSTLNSTNIFRIIVFWWIDRNSLFSGVRFIYICALAGDDMRNINYILIEL